MSEPAAESNESRRTLSRLEKLVTINCLSHSLVIPAYKRNEKRNSSHSSQLKYILDASHLRNRAPKATRNKRTEGNLIGRRRGGDGLEELDGLFANDLRGAILPPFRYP